MKVEEVKETSCVGARVYGGVDVGAFRFANMAEERLVGFYLAMREISCPILSSTYLLGLSNTYDSN